MFHEGFSAIGSELCDVGHLWEARKDGRVDTRPTGTLFNKHESKSTSSFITYIPWALDTS
jgi:hypothetical protein